MDVEVVCERGEEENLKKDAESRNVKLPPISRPLWVLQPTLWAYLRICHICHGALQCRHISIAKRFAATENQKGEVAKKGKKSAPKQGVAAESWNHPGRRDARTPTRLTPPRPVPCRFTPHRVHHDVRRRNPRGDSCPAPRSRRKAVSIRPHTQ